MRVSISFTIFNPVKVSKSSTGFFPRNALLASFTQNFTFSSSSKTAYPCCITFAISSTCDEVLLSSKVFLSFLSSVFTDNDKISSAMFFRLTTI